MMLSRFLQLAQAAVVWQALCAAADTGIFTNPPAANSFTAPNLYPVYQEGQTIELVWTVQNSDFYPISVALRSSFDTPTSVTSGISNGGSILSNTDANNTEWKVASNVISKNPTYYLVVFNSDQSDWFTSTYFNITSSAASSSSSTSSKTTSTISATHSVTTTAGNAAATTTGSTPSPSASAVPVSSSHTTAIAVGVAVPVAAILIAIAVFFALRHMRKSNAAHQATLHEQSRMLPAGGVGGLPQRGVSELYVSPTQQGKVQEFYKPVPQQPMELEGQGGGKPGGVYELGGNEYR